MLIWSPKCACTATTIWFFHKAGLYEEARAYNNWPHRYRIAVYYRSDDWLRGCGEDLSDYRILRVIRDPYQRAVSSYRHALATGYYNDRARSLLGRAIDRDMGYSFDEFLDCIGKRDLSVAMSNAHHAEQFHPIETMVTPTDVINISRQDLFSELNRIEESMALERTDFAAIEWFHSTETGSRKAKTEPFEGDAAARRFNRRDAARGPWPTIEAFLNERACARIRRLYSADFKAYGAYL